MRVLLLSDPHFDFHPVESSSFYSQEVDIDALVVAGDVANTAPWAESFFALFDGRFPGASRYFALGNHCAWIGPHARTNPGREPCVHEIARRHGFATTGEDEQWRVEAGALIFDLFYPPRMTDGEIACTVDDEYMDVRARQLAVSDPVRVLGPIRFSLSHMSPNTRIPTSYSTREPMFYNPDIDRVARAHGSRVHLFGHTHEWADSMIDGVRYVNRPVGYDAPTVDLNDFVVEI